MHNPDLQGKLGQPLTWSPRGMSPEPSGGPGLMLGNQGLVQVSDGFDGLPLARKPKVVDALVASEPL